MLAWFFLWRVFRVCRGWGEDRCSALLAEGVLESVAQLAVVCFQGADASGGCFEAAQQGCGRRALPVGDLRGGRCLLLPGPR
jgi:hypothetical protein